MNQPTADPICAQAQRARPDFAGSLQNESEHNELMGALVKILLRPEAEQELRQYSFSQLSKRRILRAFKHSEVTDHRIHAPLLSLLLVILKQLSSICLVRACLILPQHIQNQV